MHLVSNSLFNVTLYSPSILLIPHIHFLFCGEFSFQSMECIIFGEGNGTPLQYSCLENPMDGGAWKAAVHGVGHNSATSLSLFTFMHWSRKWQPTPVFLPGESRGRGRLVGCWLWGRTELDTTEATQQQQQQQHVSFYYCIFQKFSRNMTQGGKTEVALIYLLTTDSLHEKTEYL